MSQTDQTILRGVSEIRYFFARNTRPYFYFGETNVQLLGLEEWVRQLSFVSLRDCMRGLHPRVLVPTERPLDGPADPLESNRLLLGSEELAPRLRGKGAGALFLFFDEAIEAQCAELGLSVCFPSAKQRAHFDSKLGATRFASACGVASAPHVISAVRSYGHLREVAEEAGLGFDLVIQAPFGDSGDTTFFVRDEESYRRAAATLEEEEALKIMKRLRCSGSTIEACATRHGTLMGPLMGEIVGEPTLSPYRGGWCGNELAPGLFSEEARSAAEEMTRRIGEGLYERGYRGYFGLDFLHDRDTGEVYLGEINPRITGASVLTNLSEFAAADVPLFLFHLLEHSAVRYEIDVEELNARWTEPAPSDSWSLLIFKELSAAPSRVRHAPQTGVWELRPGGRAELVRAAIHRREVEGEHQAFYFCAVDEGMLCGKGHILGRLMLPGRITDEAGQLSARASEWIEAIRALHARGEG